MFEINNKVRVIKQRKTKNYEGTCGKEGFIVYIDYQMNKYGVEFPDIKNPASNYGRYYFEEGELELVENKIPTLDDIVARGLTCVIHTPNREDAMYVVSKIPSSFQFTTGDDWLQDWDRYEKNTCYDIIDGRIDSYGDKAYFEASIEQGSNYLIYEFSDLFATGGTVNIHDLPTTELIKKEFNVAWVDKIELPTATKTKEQIERVRQELKDFAHKFYTHKEKKMLTVTITEGTRARKPHEKGKSKIIETISTTVRTECGQATTTCDRSNYYDIYTGVLVAAAKITASKSEEASLLFKTAIDMWGTEMCTSILKALANRAFVNDKFDWAYKKWRKAVAYEERQNDIKARTCSVCGKVFKTVEEARAHEKWHEDCKTHKTERREAKRRLAEAEREGRISNIMAELLEERNKELTAPVMTTEQN